MIVRSFCKGYSDIVYNGIKKRSNKKTREAKLTSRVVVQMMGLEPTRANAHMTLNHACLPIPTHLRNNNTIMIARFYIVVKLKNGRTY